MRGKSMLTKSLWFLLFLLPIAVCPAAIGKIIYVDDNAVGLNEGSSWQNAYTFLQDALADAEVAVQPIEIRVAQGIYTPNRNSVLPGHTGNREDTFQLINNVTIMGGYAGFGEPDPDARSIVAYQTILSGDLATNDIEVIDLSKLDDEPTRTENSYHVLTASGTDVTAVLDGFTIADGNADGPQLWEEKIHRDRHQRGAGLYSISGNATLKNCVFTTNSAFWGAGIYSNSGSPNLNNCIFSRNSAHQTGGGMLCYDNSNPTLTNCTFTGNLALSGAGMYNYNSNPKLTNCEFIANSIEVHLLIEIGSIVGGTMYNRNSDTILSNCTFIGNQSCGILNYTSNPTVNNCTFSTNPSVGMYNYHSSPELMNCTFKGNYCGMSNRSSDPIVTNCMFSSNSTDYDGGGMDNSGSSPILTNCTFSGNRAGEEGGGIHNSDNTHLTLINCMLNGNSAYHGAAMSNSESRATLINCTLSDNSEVNPGLEGGGVIANTGGTLALINCIVWANSPRYLTGRTTVLYSNVEGGFFGEGNINVDPLFAPPGYWADVTDPNIIVDSGDPNTVWIEGDYHLKSQASRWDPSSESWVVDDLTSPCIDAGDPNILISDEPMPNGGIINMGAYGSTAEASKSISTISSRF
ncbi:MAG: right-handed parallel beta-helix repeat-containing protein [Sedimentisphaerales bacterium]